MLGRDHRIIEESSVQKVEMRKKKSEIKDLQNF